jgi:hypothetical protein
MTAEELDQLWVSVFRARAILNDARLGVSAGHDELIRTIADVLDVVDRLRCSYDAQYAHLQQARALLREMTGAAPGDDAHHGYESHAVSHDLLLRAEKYLRSTEPQVVPP